MVSRWTRSEEGWTSVEDAGAARTLSSSRLIWKRKDKVSPRT